MNTMVKSYDVRQKTINVRFSPKVVSIDCTNYTSSQELSDIYGGCRHLINLIKDDYKKIYDIDLNISNRSFLAEIWGHLIAYRIFLWIKNNIKISFVQKFATFACHRSGVIDCGEAKVDTNRWCWDLISWLFFKK